jgi:hypothetical protein
MTNFPFEIERGHKARAYMQPAIFGSLSIPPIH